LYSKLSEKVYLPKKNIWNFKVIQENVMKGPLDFQQISTLKPNFIMNFQIFHLSNPAMYSTTNNLSKTLFCIKIGQQMAETSSKEG
jgi:hypothetical protein